VSSEAVVCPHCGQPEPGKGGCLEGVLITLFVIVGIGYFVGKPSNKDHTTPVPQQQVVGASAMAVQATLKRVIAPDELNVRTGPGTQYAVAGKIYSGNIVTVSDQQQGWSKINNGWVRSKFLTDQ
jgi:SH3-like domain-containing protein